MNRSDSIAKIAPALVKALALIEGAAKTKTNGGFKTKYADLETVIDASRDILTAHGLTLIQLPGACIGGVLNLETILLHESGEYISGEMGIALGKTDPQGVGSALTYARRYAQMAALNMAAVDDDAEAAHGRGANQNARQAPSAPPAPALTVADAKAAIDRYSSIAALEQWAVDNKPATNAMHDDDYALVLAHWKAKRLALSAKVAA
ncbi:ERF family protein [Devosia sp.]|uniref:ERF family protein n=1 Tax=Devosia sp. TaxID=1871048 RepID=UPI002FC61651